MWDDITALFTQHQTDVTDLTKQLTELQAKKSDKKETKESISKLQSQIKEN